MNIEEKAFLTNITTILIKDVIIDSNFHLSGDYSNINLTIEDDISDIYLLQNYKKNLELKKNLRSKTYEERIKTFYKKLFGLSSKSFFSYLHITKDCFKELFAHLESIIENWIDITNSFSAFSVFTISWLFSCIDQKCLQKICRKYYLSPEFCEKIVMKFYQNMANSFNIFIKFPDFIEQDKALTMGTLNGLIGIIGSRKLNIGVQLENKCITNIVIQIISNLNGEIIDVEIKNEDGYNFWKTEIGKCILNESSRIKINPDCYIIGEIGYPLSSNIITPFKIVTNEKEQQLNQILMKYFEISETIFKNLLKWFDIFCNLKLSSMKELENVFRTLCIFHNLSFKFQASVFPYEEYLGLERVGLNEHESQEGTIRRQKLLEHI